MPWPPAIPPAPAKQQPVILPVAGTVVAGLAPPRATAGSAWEIMTGAPVPAGLDAVVPVERIAEHVPGGPALTTIRLLQPAQPGQNVRQMSEDFRRGDRVIDAGTRLAPHHLMGLAACGLDEVASASHRAWRFSPPAANWRAAAASCSPARSAMPTAPICTRCSPSWVSPAAHSAPPADTVAALREELAATGRQLRPDSDYRRCVRRSPRSRAGCGARTGRRDPVSQGRDPARQTDPLCAPARRQVPVWSARQSAGGRGRHALLRDTGTARDAGHGSRGLHAGTVR